MMCNGVMLRLGADEIVVAERFPDRRLDMGQAGDDRSIMRRWFSFHAVRDALGEPIAIAALQGEPRLNWIGEETAFDEDRGDLRAAENEVTAAANPAVVGLGSGDYLPMDVCREVRAVVVIIIRLDAVGFGPRRGIEMDADENRIGMGIGDGDADA